MGRSNTVNARELLEAYFTPSIDSVQYLLDSRYQNSYVLGFGNAFAMNLYQLATQNFCLNQMGLVAPVLRDDDYSHNLMTYSSITRVASGLSLYEELLCAVTSQIDQPLSLAYKKNTQKRNHTLFYKYLLDNFICFVEDGTSSYIATTSNAILMAYGKLNKLDLASLHLQTADADISKGFLNVVKLSNIQVSYPVDYPIFNTAKRCTKLTVKAGVRVTPLFLMYLYWNQIMCTLSGLTDTFMQFSYSPDKKRLCSLITGLNSDAIDLVLKDTPYPNGTAYMLNHVKFDAVNGLVTLPNLSGSFREQKDLTVSFPLLEIQSMSYVSASDICFKNVNFTKQGTLFHRYLQLYMSDIPNLMEVYLKLCTLTGNTPVLDISTVSSSEVIGKIETMYSFNLAQYGLTFQKQLHLLMLSCPLLFTNYEKYVLN